MKHSYFEKLLKRSGAPDTLSDKEREKMRAYLREYMAFKPLSLRDHRRVSQESSMLAWTVFLQRPVAAFLAVVVLVATTSSGMAVAAEGALPGDTLYPIKVSVTEPLRTALTLGAKTKASWQRSLAERRLDEAAALASVGRLSTSTEVTLARDFTSHVLAALTSEQEASGTESMDTAATDFAVRFAARQQVLARVDVERAHAAALAIETEQTSSTSPAVNTGSKGARLKTAMTETLQASGDMASGTLAASSSMQSALSQMEVLRKKGDRIEQYAQDAARALNDVVSTAARLEILTRAAISLSMSTATSTATSSPTGGTPNQAATSTPLQKGDPL